MGVGAPPSSTLGLIGVTDPAVALGPWVFSPPRSSGSFLLSPENPTGLGRPWKEMRVVLRLQATPPLLLEFLPRAPHPNASPRALHSPPQGVWWAGTLQKTPTEPREVALHGERPSGGFQGSQHGRWQQCGLWSQVVCVQAQPLSAAPPSLQGLSAQACPSPTPTQTQATRSKSRDEGPVLWGLQEGPLNITQMQPVSSPARWAKTRTAS